MNTNSLNDEKLAIYAANFGRMKSACQYYRITVPMQGIERLGLAHTFIDEGNTEKDKSTSVMLMSDIIQWWGMAGDANYDVARSIADMKAGVVADGRTIYPPSLVYDIDDNIEYIHPFNVTFGQLGVRNIDGKLLEPGDAIWTRLPDGKEVPVWDDQITIDVDGIVFDVARNRKMVNTTHKIAAIADGVTVPTKALTDYFKDVIGVKNVYTFPNSVVPDHYEWPNLAPRTDGSIRILWQGGDSHMQDWYFLKDALKEICQKYPQVKFVMWGSKYDWIYEAIPEAQLEHHYWVPYAAYRYKRVTLDVDINLAPLASNVFNKCKSAIKWYEGSLGPNPTPTLASNYGPYKEIQDGVTGLLYETPAEFVQKLSTLIEHADLRKKLGNAAKEWVLANRSIDVTVPGLFEFYKELRDMKKRKFELQEA